MSLRRKIVQQFKQPHGMLGKLAGFLMANRASNIERNEWTLELLSLKPTDRLLEIGFGPGIAIKKASETIVDGLIVGVDHSQTMLDQARKRNRDAVEKGSVQLHLGSADTLTSFEKPFDKICSSNVVQFWPDPVATFKLLRSLLVPNGVIATTYMPRHSKATDADALDKANDIVEQLKQAGFSSITIKEKPMTPISAISVLATNH